MEKTKERLSLPNNHADDDEIARYARLLDSLNVGLQVFTAEATPCFRNRHAEDLLGSGATFWLDEGGLPVAPDDHPLMLSLRNGEPVRDRILALKTQELDAAPEASSSAEVTIDAANVAAASNNDDSIWLNINALPILSDDGHVRRVLLTLTDISEMRFLQSEVAHLSIRDSLTGVFNRSHVLHLLANEIHRARRYGTPFTLAQIDLDHFRPFCVEHGQATGDKVLARVGKLLNSSMREIDIAGRIGRDDFMLILPNIVPKEAMTGLERLRSLIETQTFTADFLRITISGGITEYTGENAEAMIERCQALIGHAREAGRNRFCLDLDIL